MKHVIVAQDLSCFGKCSLTIALPVLSSAHLATSVLPSALLSTHTGGLGKPYVKGLSEDMRKILTHWLSLPLPVDALYSGYVADLDQLEAIDALFTQYPKALKVVDPAMGDHGTLYASLRSDLPKHMCRLCEKADIITPNLTEAYALLHQPWREDLATIDDVLRQLYAKTHAQIVLSGVPLGKDEIGCVVYCGDHAPIWHTQKRRSKDFHGSGDLFASAMLGAYLQLGDLHQAVEIAQTIVGESIQYSIDQRCDERFGLMFEPLLYKYHDMIFKE